MEADFSADIRVRLEAALDRARRALLDARTPTGHWEGELSSSALSTATAVTALALVEKVKVQSSTFKAGDSRTQIGNGLAWLAAHANADGGWGDTLLSVSNISTTALCWAAFGAVPGADESYRDVVQRAERWLALNSVGGKCSVFSVQCSESESTARLAQSEHQTLNTEYFPRAAPLDREQLTSAIIALYGKDRTFSVPILTMCALAGRLGEGREAWRRVIQLPFELAAFPQRFFSALRLPVVSYALPALIAIGQARHFHRPTRNPLTRLLRNATRARTLRVLAEIQPGSGGFLEATPLTSFVTMSLAGSGQADHPVVQKAVAFLLKSVRADGSWPIDTNLATWVTTLSVNSLGRSAELQLGPDERDCVLDWLLAQQYRTVHPYTRAAPGGWAWTDLSGGVPDADDTAGALLALKNLVCNQRTEAAAQHESRKTEHGTGRGSRRLLTSAATVELDPRVHAAAISGAMWLLDLQNNDGGIPTFCRGWTNLPFDRSSPDLTAHALRAWAAWRDVLPAESRRRVADAMEKALHYLANSQRPGGEWLPLWFGNQHAPDDVNPTYGTAKVLLSLAELDAEEFPAAAALMAGGADWLTAGQHDDGSWGGCPGAPASVEETALAVEALAAVLAALPGAPEEVAAPISAALRKGSFWLVEKVERGEWTQPAPIGFYFAKLWYYERLYPLIFTVAALDRMAGGKCERISVTSPQ